MVVLGMAVLGIVVLGMVVLGTVGVPLRRFLSAASQQSCVRTLLKNIGLRGLASRTQSLRTAARSSHLPRGRTWPSLWASDT
jgi:hypothetical protein